MTTANGIPAILAGTRPWVRLVSILGFVVSGFTILVGIVIAGLTLVRLAPSEGLVLAVVYPISGLLYLVPSVYLYRYASQIEDFVRNGEDWQLELALDSQRAFWKFVGILALVSIGFFVLGVAAAIIIPGILRARQF
jgi:hypothetical protein